MRFRKAKREEIEMNMTTLVDIMFILILFLILTAHYSKISSLKVSLPKAESGETSSPEEKRILVTLLSDGTTLLNGKRTTEEALAAAFAELKKAKTETPPQVVIQADKASQTGLLVHVMDLASKEGLNRISIEAVREQGSK